MNIKQILSAASFYAKKVKNREFTPNRAKQGIKTANQNSLTRLKNNQKASFSAESQTQRGLCGLRGMRFAEYGRSMVEMLGVLAVIGVLSVAGIAGYRYAMDKYRANDIIYEVNLRATDIWNRYQRMPLPEPSESGKDFLEFAQTTASGFPIYMQSKPDVAFRVFVGEVSPRICKSVLNMPLIDVIKGLQFVQVNDVKYTGNVDICGDMSGNIQNEMVFTIFLNSESDSLVNENCVEDGDCSSCCGTPTCDENTLTCRDECSGNASKPYCNQEQCACVECLTPKDCAEKGANYTCSEITNTCVEVPAECAFGKEFRTPNGVCVSCNNPNNFLVSLTPFENSALNFKDTKSGKEQCAACNNPTRYYGDVDDEKAYCSYACTNGYTYQASDGAGCVPCSDKTPHTISGDSVSKAQCLACGEDRFWWTRHNLRMCNSKSSCSINEFQEVNTGKCIPCEADTKSYIVEIHSISSNNQMDYFVDLCNKCPNRKARISLRGEMYCSIECTQPQDSPQTCDDPANCNRVWQNNSGKCLPCNDNTSVNTIYTQDETARQLCEACGREVVELNAETSYCVLKQKCAEGEFSGKDGKCYPCTRNTGVAISEDDVSCEENCKNSNITRIKKRSTQGILYCVPKCSEGQIHRNDGFCRSCNGYDVFDPLVEDECEEICSDSRDAYVTDRLHCASKWCPSDNLYFKNTDGTCFLCSNSGSVRVNTNSNAISSCIACGNRMSVNGDCYKIDPGISGVCSSLDGPLIDNLNDDIKAKAKSYLDGDHDGELFRGNDYKCYSCSDENASPGASVAQCNLCANRRYSAGKCQYGKCEETHQFLDTNNSCRDCSEKNVAVNPNEDNLCDSCDNRREMTLGNASLDTLTGKCVEECAGLQWQDSNGNCLLCGEGGNRAIGTDSESIALCNSCDNREAVASTNADGVITGYTCKIQ